MKYSKENIEYISGEKFETRYDMKLCPNEIVWRLDAIVECCKGKNVLHIGCCDHYQVIDEKIEKGIWLQRLLDETCAYVQGIDINATAVKYCNDNHYSKVPILQADITSPNFELTDGIKYNVVILGEMVEHVNNPVEFLKKVKDIMTKSGYSGKYVITVPNALCFTRKAVFMNGFERINTDHRYWFTPYTIAKVMYEAGIMPEECCFVSYAPVNSSKGQVTFSSDALMVIGE